MKKLLFLLLASMATAFAHGQTCFQKGTKWTTCISSTSEANPIITIETDTIVKDTIADGLQAMVMLRSYDRRADVEKLLIRTEENKVYFKMPDQTAAEWLLMYDFGLQVGEGCYVYAPYGDDEPHKMYVKCVETNAQDANYNGLSTLTLEEYQTDACERAYGKGVWLKGLCAAQGALYCNGFDLDGIGTTLMEASSKDGVLYSQGATSVESVALPQLSIRTNGLSVDVCNTQEGDRLCLYSTDGRLLGRTVATGNEVKLTLPKAGAYILKVGDQTRKLLAR